MKTIKNQVLKSKVTILHNIDENYCKKLGENKLNFQKLKTTWLPNERP